MAARKSTASQAPRNSKATKPTPPRTTEKPPERKRITTIPVWVVVGTDGDEVVYLSSEEAESYADPEFREGKCRIEERVAVIVDQQPDPISSANPYAVVLGDRVIATMADVDEARPLMDQHADACTVRMMLQDKNTREAERPAERRRLKRQTNPLAAKLAEEHSYVLYAVGEELGDVAELHEPSGRVMREPEDGRRHLDPLRRATDEEAALSELFVGSHFSIDVRGNIPGQVVKTLNSYIRKLQRAVDRVKLAKKQGIFKPFTDEERAAQAAESAQ